MRVTEKNKQKNRAGKIFFIPLNEFFLMFFLSPEIDSFFSEIGKNLMRALGRKKHMFFW